MRTIFSSELALLAACCRWPPSAARDAAVREQVANRPDWDHFERIVARHRVTALVENGLRCAGVAPPSTTSAALVQGATAHARNALVMAREALRLQREFDGADIRAIFVKGSTLALLAYGELGVKQSWDIDLLVSPGQAAAGRCLLGRLGYVPLGPALDDRQFARFVRFGKECVFFNVELGTSVELHWRLVENERLLAGIDVHSPTQDVGIGGGTVRTLADTPLFAFLCAHGALHGWSRLKWLADVAAFLARRDQREIEALFGEAVRLGGGRTAAAALLLCHNLLGLGLTSEFRRALRADPKAVSLERLALRCISHGGGSAEFGPYSPTGFRLTLSHFALRPGSRFFASAFRVWWTCATDRARIALPSRLAFLHHILRVPLALSRLGRNTVRKLRT